MTKDNKAVVKTEEKKEMTSSVKPDFMKDEAQSGLESLDQSDYVMPVVKLLQGTDIIVQTGRAVGGDFYHLTGEKNLGKSILVIPCFVRKRFMLFRPNEDQGSGSVVLARADDAEHWKPANASFTVKLKGKKEAVTWTTKPTVAESGLAEFGSMDPDDPESKPAATLIYDLVCLLPNQMDISPAIISLKGSSVSKAKSFFTGLRHSKAPIFGLMFEFFSSVEKNGSNSYQAYNIKDSGFVNDESLYNQGKELNALCASQNFRGDVDDEPEPEVAAATGKVNDKY